MFVQSFKFAVVFSGKKSMEGNQEELIKELQGKIALLKAVGYSNF